ncbi:MAG: hypothetical protein KA479_10000 [Saprospiraceae bacterium]|nr:hypothetical protein [Saprospiraceae bacterium]
MESHKDMLEHNENLVIPCPVCKNDIHFEMNTLLQGAQFGCSNCDTKVGLQANAIPQARDIFSTFTGVKELITMRPNKATYRAKYFQNGAGDASR